MTTLSIKTIFSFVFLGLHLEVPRLGVEMELQMLAYAVSTAMPDLSQVCDLHHSSWQRQILNPKAGPGIDPTSSWILVRFVNHCATMGTPWAS